MTGKEIISGVMVSSHTLTFVEVCQHCHLSEEIVGEWVAHGLLGEPIPSSLKQLHFNDQMIQRIRKASQLQQELDLNMQGVILALELLDQLSDLRKELSILKRIYSD